MDECGLLGLALAVLAGQVHGQGQQPRAQEAADARGNQVDETEPWEREWYVVRKGPLCSGQPPNGLPVGGSETYRESFETRASGNRTTYGLGHRQAEDVGLGDL